MIETLVYVLKISSPINFFIFLALASLLAYLSQIEVSALGGVQNTSYVSQTFTPVNGSIDTTAGNVYTFNLTTTDKTYRWVGLWGSVTGDLSLKTTTAFFYTWYNSTATADSVVYATTDDSGVDPTRCLPLLEHVDLFVPNEDEARILTGEVVPELQAKALLDAGAGAVVVTRGAQGLFADDGKRTVEMGIFKVPVVDPSGCGDCFTAGLIAGMSREWDFVHVLEFSSAVGAIGATTLGCTDGVPPFAEVESFVKENKIEISVEPDNSQ